VVDLAAMTKHTRVVNYKRDGKPTQTSTAGINHTKHEFVFRHPSETRPITLKNEDNNIVAGSSLENEAQLWLASHTYSTETPVNPEISTFLSLCVHKCSTAMPKTKQA